MTSGETVSFTPVNIPSVVFDHSLSPQGIPMAIITKLSLKNEILNTHAAVASSVYHGTVDETPASSRYDGVTSYYDQIVGPSYAQKGFIVSGHKPLYWSYYNAQSYQLPGFAELNAIWKSCTIQAMAVKWMIDWENFDTAKDNTYYFIYRWQRAGDIPEKKSTAMTAQRLKYDESWTKVEIRNPGSTGNGGGNQTSEAQRLTHQTISTYMTWNKLYDHEDDNEFLDARKEVTSLTNLADSLPLKPMFLEWDVIALRSTGTESWWDANQQYSIKIDVDCYYKFDRLDIDYVFDSGV